MEHSLSVRDFLAALLKLLGYRYFVPLVHDIVLVVYVSHQRRRHKKSVTHLNERVQLVPRRAREQHCKTAPRRDRRDDMLERERAQAR